jgi:hypothetical protein
LLGYSDGNFTVFGYQSGFALKPGVSDGVWSCPFHFFFVFRPLLFTSRVTFQCLEDMTIPLLETNFKVLSNALSLKNFLKKKTKKGFNAFVISEPLKGL